MESEFGSQALPTTRRAARELALRALYHIEATRATVPDAIVACRETIDIDDSMLEFAEELIRGTYDNRNAIDDLIQSAITEKWDLYRLASTDRAALRVACFELFHCPGIPPKATINEAIVLAKKYGSAESGKFVNGVLGALLLASPKADWDPSLATVVEIEDQPEEEHDIETITEGSPEFAEIEKVGAWRIKTETEESLP